MQLSGDDQWSNILAGVDLIQQKEKLLMEWPYLATVKGRKWVKRTRCSLVDKKLLHTTFISTETLMILIKVSSTVSLPAYDKLKARSLEGAETMKLKVLIWGTKIIHGEEKAEKANYAEALFTGAGNLENVPTSTIVKILLIRLSLIFSWT